MRLNKKNAMKYICNATKISNTIQCAQSMKSIEMIVGYLLFIPAMGSQVIQ